MLVSDAEPTGAISLRYGENPQQHGLFVPLDCDDPLALSRFAQVCGPALSYTNYLDADGALFALAQLGARLPACVIVKHATPCGAARGETIDEAYQRAWAGDPIAAFGCALALNRPVTTALAELMLRGRVVHLLLCPAVEAEAMLVLQRRASLRVLVNPALHEVSVPRGREWRTVRGGVLMQDVYDGRLDPDRLQIVTATQPAQGDWEDIHLAWGLATATRSNAVALVKDGMLLGAGAGQQDRRSACRLAVAKAGARAAGAVAASDGAFPFARADAVEELIAAGVAIIVQPGGARRDAEAIALCDEHGVAMLFTGVRGFRH